MSFLTYVWQIIDGYKLYFIGTVIILAGIFQKDGQQILEGLACIAGRHAISKIEK